jgi:hypothetical protein
MTSLEELDRLAEKFIVGHKSLSNYQKDILLKIEEMKKQERILENRKKRIQNLIIAMYNKLANSIDEKPKEVLSSGTKTGQVRTDSSSEKPKKEDNNGKTKK